MKIQKRDGRLEQLSFDKIIYRLKKLCNDKNLGSLSNIDPDIIAQKVVSSIYDGVTSMELDEEAARIAISMTEHIEYSKLASRITISNLHKSTHECFSEVMELLWGNTDKNGKHSPIIADDIIEIIRQHKNTLNFAIDYSRDYNFDYFGFKTLEKSYLMKIFDKTQGKMKVVERPQHLYMRVALGIHKEDIENVLKTYSLISQHFYTHASPTMFNAGGRLSNLSSCFLMNGYDSIEGIFKAITDCGKISKVGGGIGVHISNIRAKGSIIRGTNGPSDGIIPMLKVYNETAKYINQGSRRKGSFSFYLEPWHADIMEFLELKKNQGHEDMRARDLFYALWIPDLFMKQVENDGDWYLMCPDECPGLPDAYGDAFEKLYSRYVNEKKYRKVVKAQEIWRKMMDSQIETGVPYIGFKDAVNKKCNQKNLGTIKSSNLCVAPETMILTSKGYFKIEDLKNKEIEVWNGEEFSKTIVRQTGENQKLLKVKLSNGCDIECTPYHKFYIVTGKRPAQYPKLIQIEAKELKEGMKLIKSNFPIIKDGLTDFITPYEHGLFCADGTLEHNTEKNTKCNNKSIQGSSYCKRHLNMYKHTNIPLNERCQAILGGLPRITLYGEKKKLADLIETRVKKCEEDSNKRINCRLLPNIKKKYYVPINYNLDIKLKWLQGLCDGDGTIVKSDKLTSIQISNSNTKFLKNVQYMLQTMGCDPKITKSCEADLHLLPDGKGGKQDYYCNAIYRLLITSHDVALLHSIGFRPNRLKISDVYPRKNTKRWIQVMSVEKTNRIADTYCFKEEKRGMGIFNGVLTGQCLEISLYSDHENYACCNLASLALPKYVEYDENNKPFFNHQKLKEVTEHVILAMNKVIDNNYYPTPETAKTNFKHRPLAIGVNGLADVYIKMRMSFDSPESKQLNKEIFETLYYGCLNGSLEEAKRHGAYETFKGSPFSEGKLQFDLAAEFDNRDLSEYLSGRWDWDTLRSEIKEYGVRNSMLTGLMPTASSAILLNNSECFEPIDSCIFKRRTLSGEYMVVNKYLIEDLTKLGIWSKELKEKIIAMDGSIQNIDEIPDDIKKIYKTVWETSMKAVIEQAGDRQLFVDQMQSMNLFMAAPNYKKLSSMLFYSWKNNLKSGMYYLRSKGSYQAGKFSIDASLEKSIRDKMANGKETTKEEEKLICSIDNKEECMACSS
jgi:ribonucleoside-diphosphate reductase alpha chain